MLSYRLRKSWDIPPKYIYPSLFIPLTIILTRKLYCMNSPISFSFYFFIFLPSPSLTKSVLFSVFIPDHFHSLSSYLQAILTTFFLTSFPSLSSLSSHQTVLLSPPHVPRITVTTPFVIYCTSTVDIIRSYRHAPLSPTHQCLSVRYVCVSVCLSGWRGVAWRGMAGTQFTFHTLRWP